MELTNKFGLPEPLMEAVRMDPYDDGANGRTKYITVTAITNPPQLTKLFWEHQANLTEDVSERIWSLLGQSVHSVLERVAKSDRYSGRMLAEHRLYAQFGDWHIGGQIDLYDLDKRTLHDFKVTSVYSVTGEMKAAWRRQLNILMWLLRKNGYEPERGEIVAILRDWSRSKRKFDHNYPDHPAVTLEAELADDELVEMFIARQLEELEKDQPRDCTPEERWIRGGNWAVMPGDGIKWAVMKEGRKTAVKVYDSEREALLHAETEPWFSVEKREPKTQAARRAVRVFATALEAEQFIVANAEAGYRLEGREAVYQRCEAYCPVRALCRQAQGDSVNFVDP